MSKVTEGIETHLQQGVLAHEPVNTDDAPEDFQDIIQMESVIPGQPPLVIQRQPSFDDHLQRQREELLVRRGQ